MPPWMNGVQTFSSPLMLEAHRTDLPRELGKRIAFPWKKKMAVNMSLQKEQKDADLASQLLPNPPA